MEKKKRILLAVLVVGSLAAYAFLYDAQMVATANEVTDGVVNTLDSDASPDVYFLKRFVHALVNLLPAAA